MVLIDECPLSFICLSFFLYFFQVGACGPGLLGRLLGLLGAGAEAQGGLEELPQEALTQIYQVGRGRMRLRNTHASHV